MVEATQILKQVSGLNELTCSIQQINDLLADEEIDADNKEAVLEAIKKIKDNENEIRVLRQKLENKYFCYVNKIHMIELKKRART